MKATIIKNTVVPFAICFCLALALYPGSTIDPAKYSTDGIDLHFVYPFNDEDLSLIREEPSSPIVEYSPLLKKDFQGFKEALAFKESGGNYFSVNTFGYLGKYQFGSETLKLVGVYNTDMFLESPVLQEEAFLANTKRNKWILRNYIQKFNGKTVAGIEVTESGILAAAHLAGPGSVKKFLRSYGKQNFKDGYGSTLSSYMETFSGYDTSQVEANRTAKVSI